VYLAALEAGTPLNRATFLSDHAHLAADLPSLLDQLEQVQGVRRAAEVVVPRPAEGLTLPHAVGEYRLVREIGRGGMGVVYEAEHAALRRRVAVKVVHTPDTATRDRLLHEARVASLLVHPHVVPVHAVGEGSGFAFIVMHFVDGQSLGGVLRAMLRPAPPPDEDASLVADGLLNGFGPADPDGTTPLGYLRRVVRLMANAADALGFAHGRDILHRDVKPGNLLLDVRGHVWLTDFGLARQVSPDVTLGDRVGTPRYMASELLADDDHRTRVGPEADVYALGATLYELLARRPAFDGDTDADLRANIRAYRLTQLSRLAPQVPTDLSTVVHKAMARLPADRYPNAAVMADDLRRFLTGQPVTARPLSFPQRTWRWAARRSRSLAVAAAALGCGLAVAAGVGWWGYTKQTQARQELEQREAILRELVAEVNKSEAVFRHLPQGQAEHRRLVGALKEVVCKWADEPNAPFETKIEAVRACVRLGEVTSNAGLQDDSLAAFNESLNRVTALRATCGVNPTLRFLAAETHKCLAGQHLKRGVVAEAETHALAADELFRGLIAEAPERASYRNPLSRLYTTLANIVQAEGRPAERVAWLRKGLAEDEWLAAEYPTGHPQSYIRLAITWDSLGEALVATGDATEAAVAFRQAVSNDRKLRTDEFALPRTNREYTCGMPIRLAAHLLAVGNLDEAGAILKAAVHDVEALAAEFPDRPTFIRLPPHVHHLLGQWHYLCDRPAEAKLAFRRAIDLSRQATSVSPSVRAKYQLLQPFPELIDGRVAGDELAAIEQSSPHADHRFWRLALAVGLGGRDGVTAALAASRRPPIRPDLARACEELEAVHLARGGDPTGAKAALPPLVVDIDGWSAICRKVVAGAK
jgi:serine/threonine protein kinase